MNSTFLRGKNISTGLSLIVKNEETRIKEFLDRNVSLFDQVVVIDTGSSDRTTEYLKKYQDDGKIEFFTFPMSADFSAARNYAFSKLTTDYIFWLDADDELTGPAIEFLTMLNKRPFGDFDSLPDGYLFNYQYYLDGSSTPEFDLFRLQLIKRCVAPLWKYKIYEQIVCPDGARIEESDFVIRHKISSEDFERKSKRNLSHLMDSMNSADVDGHTKLFLVNTLFSSGEIATARTYARNALISGSSDELLQIRLLQCDYLLGDRSSFQTNFQLYRNIKDEIDHCLKAIYLDEIGEKQAAEAAYLQCLKTTLQSRRSLIGRSERTRWLRKIPGQRLVDLYVTQGRIAEAQQQKRELLALEISC